MIFKNKKCIVEFLLNNYNKLFNSDDIYYNQTNILKSSKKNEANSYRLSSNFSQDLVCIKIDLDKAINKLPKEYYNLILYKYIKQYHILAVLYLLKLKNKNEYYIMRKEVINKIIDLLTDDWFEEFFC